MSIHYIRNRDGQVTSVRAVAAKVSGIQIRSTFSVKKHGSVQQAEKAASRWAKAKGAQVERNRANILDVPDYLLSEIIECRDLLKPYNKAIIEVVREYVARPEHRTIPWTFREAADIFLESRRIAGKRKEYLRSLEDIFNLASKTFGLDLLDEIRTEDIERWLGTRGRDGPLSPVTFRNYRRDLRMLWRFARARHRCAHDPVTPITVPSISAEPVKILKAEELKKLLDHMPGNRRVYAAVMAFAGVRPFEVIEIDKNSIDQCYNYLSISGLHAKSRKRRLVTITANLAEWLRREEGLGQIRSYWTLHHMLKNSAIDAGITLAQDVLRHSFASHHLALNRNAALTAHEMGHHNTQMLYEHYRELVTQQEAAAYFGILPP